MLLYYLSSTILILRSVTTVYDNSNSVAPETEDGYIKVNQLSMNEFRRRLITHFNIAFKQNIVKWPSRNKIVS